MFTNNIEKITMLFLLNEDNINIRPYKDEVRDYEEIAIIQISINDKSKSNMIGEIVQSTIPYPTIIIFTMDDEVQINVATKMINKVDSSKNTVETMISSYWLNINNISIIEKEFIESLSIVNLSFANFYRFYMDIYNRVFLLNTSQYFNEYKSLLAKNIEIVKKSYYEIHDLDFTLERLRREIKKEDNFSRKAKLNVEIKSLEKETKIMINKILNLEGDKIE